MFYRVIKILARCSLLFFFRKKIVCGASLQNLQGPAIIAANHPNSLMDAVVIGCACSQPVHFTIRSDMFKNSLFKFLLKRLNGIPVYRSTEEKDKMRENFTTIQRCKAILKQNGIIIIFAEGYTLHDWELKPIKSGISKIAMHAIEDSYLKEKLTILPVGLTYSDYRHPAKTIIIQSGNLIYPGSFQLYSTEGKWKQAFNTTVFQHMQPLVPRMASKDEKRIKAWQILLQNVSLQTKCITVSNLHVAANKIEQSTTIPVLNSIKRKFLCNNKKECFKSLLLLFLLLLPGVAGILLNSLFYFPVSRWAYSKTKDSIFYDALLCGLLTVVYPVYIIAIGLLLKYTTSYPFWMWVIVLPFTGWCAVQAHTCLLEIINYLCLSEEDRKSMNEIML